MYLLVIKYPKRDLKQMVIVGLFALDFLLFLSVNSKNISFCQRERNQIPNLNDFNFATNSDLFLLSSFIK